MATKFTKDAVDKIIEHISDGAYIETACKAAGIHRTTFRTWMNKGIADIEEGNKDTEHAKLVARFDHAYAQCEVDLLLEIREAHKTKRNWQNLAWILERTRQDKYGQRQTITTTQEMAGPQLPPNPPKDHAEWLERSAQRQSLLSAAAKVEAN